MAAYILFKNITQEEVDRIINFLNSVSKNSNYGPIKEEAIGVCTTEINNTFTYLNEYMCNRENPYISWTMCRKEYFSVDDFINKINEELDEYNRFYKFIPQ